MPHSRPSAARPGWRERLRRRVLADDLLAVEAAVALGLARLALLLPYRHYRAWLELRPGQSGSGPVAEPGAVAETAQRVARAVRRAARRTPWSAVCLPQAMAGKLMLQRRGIASCLVLGAQSTRQPSLQLHAWLEVEGRILLGARGAESCAVLGRYGG